MGRSDAAKASMKKSTVEPVPTPTHDWGLINCTAFWATMAFK
jgi:cytosine/uracil/thiamine/allantoin permease